MGKIKVDENQTRSSWGGVGDRKREKTAKDRSSIYIWVLSKKKKKKSPATSFLQSHASSIKKINQYFPSGEQEQQATRVQGSVKV